MSSSSQPMSQSEATILGTGAPIGTVGTGGSRNGYRPRSDHRYAHAAAVSVPGTASTTITAITSFPYYSNTTDTTDTTNGALSAISNPTPTPNLNPHLTSTYPDALTTIATPPSRPSFDFVSPSPAFPTTTTTTTTTTPITTTTTTTTATTTTSTTYGSVDPQPALSTESHMPSTLVLPRRPSPSVPASNIGQSPFQIPSSAIPVIPGQQPPMRYLHSDLAVLSAEQYDDGRVTKRSGSVVTRKLNTSRASPLETVNPKKRGRKPSEEGHDEPEEETKRARGRPRLDTTDQTPSERRRTQIRLAQRAYRNRKETAITDLEAKVNDLKEANQEIRSAYQGILDFATQHGIMSQVPELGRKLQNFQDLLVKKAAEARSPKSSDGTSPERDLTDEADREVPVTRKTKTSKTTTSSWSDPPDSMVLKSSQPKPVYAGIMVSHEPASQDPQHPSSKPELSSGHGPAQYDIITQPTSQNASFASNMAFDMSFLDASSFTTSVHSPWSSLPVPGSTATSEWAFSRRLHRRATERAVTILMSPNPNPLVINRAFGFVRLFETLEQTRNRLLGVLSRMKDEPLNNWKMPFHHVGGAGTHYASKDGLPNAYLDAAPFVNNGYGMGPFGESIMRIRDGLLSSSQYVSKPGWEGVWFDAYEVETYLMHNGITLHITADIQTIDLPPDSMFRKSASTPAAAVRWPQQATNQSQTTISSHMPTTTVPSTSSAEMNLDHDIPTTAPPPTLGYEGATYPSPVSSADGMGMASMPTDDWQSMTTGSEWGPSGISSMVAFDSGMCFPDASSQFLFPPHGNEAAPGSTRVVINVANFIETMCSRASCLGRAACFRPADVIDAFWESVVEE
ncbi:hypothetical protein F4809DRAFT_57577 [Biscogniauxia mediterranea]|nr:hypothetical protein F4809DRAFT_57577 [Biscogniauxia mediterranea]